MDISNALIAKSDQLNSIDLIGEPRTVTVVDVVQGNPEQPVNIITDAFGPGRPFKPSKTVLRILVGAWGRETNDWIGHRMTIYREPSVKWAGEEVGGIRIEALSHIDKAIVFNLPTSKGKHAKSTVVPLPAEVKRDWQAEMDATDNTDALTALYKTMCATPGAYNDQIKAAFGARGATIKAAQATTADGEQLI